MRIFIIIAFFFICEHCWGITRIEEPYFFIPMIIGGSIAGLQDVFELIKTIKQS
jgi:hypothetical protein